MLWSFHTPKEQMLFPLVGQDGACTCEPKAAHKNALAEQMGVKKRCEFVEPLIIQLKCIDDNDDDVKHGGVEQAFCHQTRESVI